MSNPQIDTLVKRIAAARDAYYNGSPIMTDVVYDALEDQLRALDPKHPELLKVGAAPAPVKGAWPKVRHSIPMSSLNKAQVETDLAAWFASVSNADVAVMDKLDGISCFDGATPLHLANGETVPLQEVVEKGLMPQVLTWDPERGVTTEQVVAVKDNGIKDNWVRVTFETDPLHLGSSVVVTEDHLFYVKDKGWVEAKDLTGEDVLDCTEQP